MVTELTYVFHSESGVNVPIRFSNGSITEFPCKILLGFRDILEKDKKPDNN